jgi:hypothetical protein
MKMNRHGGVGVFRRRDAQLLQHAPPSRRSAFVRPPLEGTMRLSLRVTTFARTRGFLALAAGLSLVAGSVGSVAAAGPANDSSRKPIVIGSIPYTNTQDTSGATSSHSDPGNCIDPSFGPDPATIWYEYTATETGPLGATTFGSDYDTTLYVGTPARGGGIDVIACGDDSRTLQSTVRFDATASVTYLFMASASPFGGGQGGNLVFNLDVGPVAQVVDLTFDPVGSMSGTDVIFHGTVSCTAPTDLGSLVITELVQTDGNEAAGTGFVDVPGCPGSELPYEMRVPNDIGRFRPGEATAQFQYHACNTFECGAKTIDATVQIVR